MDALEEIAELKRELADIASRPNSEGLTLSGEDIELSASDAPWERSVEFAFANWLTAHRASLAVEIEFNSTFDRLGTIAKRCKELKKCLGPGELLEHVVALQESLGKTLKEVLAKAAFNAALTPSYIPFAGGLEKLLGDGVAVSPQARYTLIEFKGSVDKSAWKREALPKSDTNPGGKARKAVFNRLKKMNPPDTFCMGNRCHILLGSALGDQKRRGLYWIPYPKFISSTRRGETEEVKKLEKPVDDGIPGVTYPFFEKYVSEILENMDESGTTTPCKLVVRDGAEWYVLECSIGKIPKLFKRFGTEILQNTEVTPPGKSKRNNQSFG